MTPRYLPSIGGAEIHCYEVARRLASAGNDVTILTTDLTGQLPVVELSEGMRIVRVRAWPRGHDYYFAPGIYHAMTRGRWDIIHSQCCHTLVAPLAMLAAIRLDIPFVVTFHSGGHSSWVRNVLRGAQWTMLRPLLAQAQRLIGVSQFEAQFFRKQLRLPPTRFAIIPNGSYLPKAPDMRPQNNSGPLIVSVGRLERYKGHHRAIAALPKVIEQFPGARLRIVGAGPYESKLWRFARDYGVAHRVEIGKVAPSDRAGMASVLANAALMILLSDYESQGIAVLESLSLGRPVLVADTAGLHELVENQLVRAIPRRSTANQVATAIIGQLRQPLIPPTIDLPTWDACAADVLAVYRTIMRYTITERSLCVS